MSCCSTILASFPSINVTRILVHFWCEFHVCMSCMWSWMVNVYVECSWPVCRSVLPCSTLNTSTFYQFIHVSLNQKVSNRMSCTSFPCHCAMHKGGGMPSFFVMNIQTGNCLVDKVCVCVCVCVLSTALSCRAIHGMHWIHVCPGGQWNCTVGHLFIVELFVCISLAACLPIYSLLH